MVHGKMFFRILTAKILICIMIVSSVILSTPGVFAQAAAQPSLSKKSAFLLVGEKVDLNVNGKIKKSTYKWSTSNKKVATVTNMGVVDGLKKGTATITCTVKAPQKTYKLTSKITVIAAAESVSISNKVNVLNQGQVYDLNYVLTPKTSNDKVTWSSSDKKIAAPDASGKFTALKAGTVTITAKTLRGLKTSLKIRVTDRDGTITNQAELEELLGSRASQITIKTKEATNFTIPEGDYKQQTLTVDAPNADVVNHGTFKNVNILQIKSDTWYENAINNVLNVAAPNARLIIERNASATVAIIGNAANVNLVNNGTLRELQVNTDAKVEISGTSGQSIPVSAGSAGATITSSVPLTLTCTARINLVLLPGAENTVVHVDNEASVPVVTGSGSITVIIGTGDAARTVTVGATSNTAPPSGGNEGYEGNVPTPTPSPSPEPIVKGSITGRVTAVSGSSISLVSNTETPATVSGSSIIGATVYVLKYDGDINSAVASIFNNPNTVITVTGPDGYYAVTDLEAGNYIVVIAKAGYKVLIQLTTVTQGAVTVVNGTLIESANEQGGIGTASGSIKDAVTGTIVDGNLEFSITVYDTTRNQIGVPAVVTGSAFSLELPEGYYTIKIEDNRSASFGVTYATTTRNIVVLGGSTFENQDVYLATLKEGGQATFVLTWGENPWDLDSHLLGPAEGRQYFHIYYIDKDYPVGVGHENFEELHLRLDRDDVDSYGPETTSIYKPVAGGIYYFYVYNYSGNQGGLLVNSSAKVVVTTSRGTYTFDVPAGGEQRSWLVCSYNSATDEVTQINQLFAGDYFDTYLTENGFVDYRGEALETIN